MDIDPFRYDFEEIICERFSIKRTGRITKSKNDFVISNRKNTNNGEKNKES